MRQPVYVQSSGNGCATWLLIALAAIAVLAISSMALGVDLAGLVGLARTTPVAPVFSNSIIAPAPTLPAVTQPPVQPVQPVQVAPTPQPVIVAPVQPVQPVIVQPAPTVQPAPVEQPAVQLQPAGEFTAEFLAACADGQAQGRRVSPRCPANAAELLGGGR